MAVMIFDTATENVDGVIFDLDGVLLDTEKLYARFWQEASIALGYPMTRQQALGMRSLSRAAGQAKLESYFGPGVDREVMRQKRIALMDAYIEENGVECMSGVLETVQQLKGRGLKIAIATSSPIERVERYLGPKNLLGYFDVVCSGHDVPLGKPAPDIYLRAAACIGLAPERCLAVEDSPAGIQSAFDAGCLPVFIPDQDEADEQTLKRLYARVEALPDLLQLLK